MRICAVDSFSDRGNTYRRETIAIEKMLAAFRLSNIFWRRRQRRDAGGILSKATIDSSHANLSTQQGELTLEVIESLGVFSQYHRFVLVVDVFSFENFIDLMQRIFHWDFVGKIRSKHAALWPDPFDDIGQYALVPLATDEKSIAAKVIDDRLLATKLTVLPFAFEPVNDQRNPARTAFQKTNFQFGKCVPHAVLNHSGHGDREGEWHT